MKNDQLSVITADDDNNDDDQGKWYHSLSNLIGIIVLLIVSLMFIFCGIHNDFIAFIISSFLKWMENNIIIGSILYIFVHIICNLLIVPGCLLTVGAGYLFFNLFNSFYGIFISLFIVLISRFIGWTFTFLFSRYLFKSVIHLCCTQKLKKKYIFINKIIKLNEFRVCVLLRLSPVTPYSLLNYIMGVTDVQLKYYIFGSIIGCIPDAILYCLIGASIESLSKLNTIDITSNLAVLIIIVILTVVPIIGIIYIGYLSQKELQRFAVENNIHSNDSDIELMISTDPESTDPV